MPFIPDTRPITSPISKGASQAEEAKKFLEKPWYKQIFTGQFAKEIPGAISKVFLKTPAKFITSAAEVPETLIKGRATQRTYPFVGKSYISEAETRAQQIVSGEKPLWYSLAPFAEVPLAALETVALAKTAVNFTKKSIKFISDIKGKRALQDALDLTSPTLYKKKTIEAFEKAGKPGGIVEKGITKEYVVAPTKKDKEVAKSVMGFVNKNKSPVSNLKSVNKEIARISVKEVKPFLEANSKKLYPNVLTKKLEAVEPATLIKTDRTLENTFDLVKRRIIEVVVAKADDTPSLWDTRIDIDGLMKKEFGDRLFDPDKNFAVKDAYLKMRRAINDLIAQQTPNKTFINQMKKLSNMYIARQNIAENSWRLLETNAFQRFLKSHPALVKGFKWTTILGGGGYGLRRLLKGY